MRNNLMEREMLKRLLMSLMILAVLPLLAVAEDNYVEGTHYDLITPAMRTADADKIEVAEFFWYGCGHCYSFEPIVGQWQKTLADDVDFRGIPAMWGGSMELHAKAFYAAEVLGVRDSMHMVLFQAMNVDRKRLSSESEIAALFSANGVSAEDLPGSSGQCPRPLRQDQWYPLSGG
jgi:thiol:disulfide interchange protein DsbA